MAQFWAEMFKFPMILPLEEKCLKDIFWLACTTELRWYMYSPLQL